MLEKRREEKARKKAKKAKKKEKRKDETPEERRARKERKKEKKAHKAEKKKTGGALRGVEDLLKSIGGPPVAKGRRDDSMSTSPPPRRTGSPSPRREVSSRVDRLPRSRSPTGGSRRDRGESYNAERRGERGDGRSKDYERRDRNPPPPPGGPLRHHDTVSRRGRRSPSPYRSSRRRD